MAELPPLQLNLLPPQRPVQPVRQRLPGRFALNAAVLYPQQASSVQIAVPNRKDLPVVQVAENPCLKALSSVLAAEPRTRPEA